MRSLTLFLPILLLGASPALARESLGVFDGWGAFRDPETPRCYAIAQPSVPGGQASRGFASVGSWPRRGVRAQPHFRLSRERSNRAAATLGIAQRRFTLAGSGADAWSADRRMDAAIIAAMRSGTSMSIESVDRAGHPFVDVYRLRGAATAIDAAALACARIR